MTRQAAGLIDELRSAIVRVLGAADDAEHLRLEQARSADGRRT